MNKHVAIVTPVGNEMRDIGGFYDALLPILEEVGAVWITVFDEVCKDGTDKWLESHKGDNVCVLRNDSAQGGLAGAYIYGDRYATDRGFDKIIEVDVGHPVELVGAFSDLLDKYDVVMGRRDSNRNPLTRRAISKMGTLLSRLVLGLPYADCTSGLQGITLRVARRMPWDSFLSFGHFYQTEFKFYCKNIPFCEVPFDHHGGESTLSAKSILDSLRVLFELRRRIPIEWRR